MYFNPNVFNTLSLFPGTVSLCISNFRNSVTLNSQFTILNILRMYSVYENKLTCLFNSPLIINIYKIQCTFFLLMSEYSDLKALRGFCLGEGRKGGISDMQTRLFYKQAP